MRVSVRDHPAPRAAKGGVDSLLDEPTALVVEDEPDITALVTSSLRNEGLKVSTAGTGADGLASARALRPEVVVLDLGLPDLDGVEVCRVLREFSNAYVIMLTGRGHEVDLLVGLAVGADHYMAKPFSPRELQARVRTLLRRPVTAAAAPQLTRFDALTIDRNSRTVMKDDRLIELTRTEFDLLAVLSDQPRTVFTRRMLLQEVWGSDFHDEHLVNVHMANLRRKLEDGARNQRFITTIRGVGYRMSVG